jgi:hypothetical protein
MGDILVCAGELANLLARASVVGATSEATGYPLSYAYDGRSSEEFRFASAVADGAVTADLNLIANGSMETSTLSGWTDRSVGTSNSIGEELTNFDTGAKAMKMILTTAGASNYAQGTWDVSVRAGERMTLNARLRGNGTVYARIRVRNLQTGKYLTSGGAWGTVQDAGTRQTASYATTAITFTVETFAQCLGPTATLRVTVLANEASNTGTVYADNVYLWPSWDLMSMHGHNVYPTITAQARSSTDNFSGSDVLKATFTLAAPTCYAYLGVTPCDDRYARLKFVGTPHEAIRLGEIVVARVTALARPPSDGAELTYSHPDIVSETAAGEQYVRPLAEWPRRVFALKFNRLSATQKAEAENEVFRRSAGRAYPLLVVPDTSLADVLLARIDRDWKVRRLLSTYYTDNDLVLSELPFAVRAS